MLEIRRRRQRLHHRIRKFFGEDAREACAELLASHTSGGARIIAEQEFQLAWFCLPEALDFQKDAVRVPLLDAQESSRQIALVRPQMNQRALSLVVHFAVQAGEFSQSFAIFANFHRTRRSQCHQFAFEFRPIVWRRRQASTTRSLINSSCFYFPGVYCRTRPVTVMMGYS